MLSFVLALAIFAQADPTSRSWNQPVEPFRIIGNIYYVGANEITSYLIVTPAGMILIDGGFAETAPMIRANVAELGFNIHDVKILLNSHAHFDHAGGLAELKRVTGAEFYASAPDLPILARGGYDDPQFGDRLLFSPIEADHVVRDNDRITLGDTTLTAHITPGHTKGCTTWTMTATDQQKRYDVVFLCSASVPSEYNLVTNPKYPNEIGDYRRTFAVLAKLPCDVPLGSHGSFFNLSEKRAVLAKGRDPNPFIDPAGYKAYVESAKKRFRAVVRAQKPE
jgi:metallo-beta-lactamase class B